MERRVILVSDRLVGGAGLLVSRMLGLRNPEQFSRGAAARRRAAVGGRPSTRMRAARAGWSSILPALVREQRFLEVGA